MKKEKQLTPEQRKEIDLVNSKINNEKNQLNKSIARRRNKNKAARHARKQNRK